jgi:hypothetical protein
MSINIFSCENCCHAVINDNRQTGCKLNKLAKIPHSMNEDKKFFDLKKVCQYKDRDPNNIKAKIGYIFILDNPDNIEQLKQNIEQIKNSSPLWIGVNIDFPDLAADINDYLIGLNIPYNIISNYEKIAGDIYRLDQFMNNYKNGWTIVNIVGQTFDINMPTVLNNYLNDLNSLAIAKYGCGSLNGFTFFNMVFKYLKGSYPSILEDDTIMQKDFIEKTTEVSPEMIKDWKDIYEIYSTFSN